MRHADGKFRNTRTYPGVGYAHPHAVEATNQAGTVDHKNVGLTLGKTPKPKTAFTTAGAPQVHSGMTGKARSDGKHFAGLSGQDLSRYDADPGSALTGGDVMGHNLPQGKRLAPVAPVKGQTSQTNNDCESLDDKAQHGADMLASAVRN